MLRLRGSEERFVASRRVLLHFHGETASLDGYIVKETRGSVWLRQAKVLESQNREFDLEGTQIVPRTRIWWTQVLEEAAG